MNDFTRRYTLIQHEENCRNYTESQKATVEFSKMALRGAFALNGMAAIAVLYSPKIAAPYTVLMAGYFATGALLAAIASGSTYLSQYAISLTWRKHLYQSPQGQDAATQGKEQRRAERNASLFRIAAVALTLVAYSCFGLGAYHGYTQVKETAQKQAPQPESPQSPTPKAAG